MSTLMTLADIERRLRTPAPDEPSVLPPLTLPTHAARLRATTRLRASRSPGTQVQPVYVAVLLLLALAAAIVAFGALRTLTDRDDRLANACSPFGSGVAEPGSPECRAVAVPEGWTVLGAGQIYPGDFTEAGLGYEYVQLVMANVPIGGCASPGGPFPTARAVGTNEFEQPYPTPDAGLLCLREAVLPANGIRVEAMEGQRITGLAPAGYGIPDTSEPTEAAGWTEEVAGRPARLTIATRVIDGMTVETRTWDILKPGQIDQVLRIRADIAGPELAAGRAAVQRIVDAVDFRRKVPSLDESQRDDVVRGVLDGLERNGREAHTDLFACFPRSDGSREARITGGFAGPLSAPIDVTCSTAVTRSAADLWRIVLDVVVPVAGNGVRDTLRMEVFAAGEEADGNVQTTGGYITSLGGRAQPQAGVDAWFPTAAYQLPPPLGGATLELPAGSIVRVLWPGEAPVAEPGEADDSIYPGVVGMHLFVVDGPRVVGGEAWYRVQSGPESAFGDVGWIRGTRDGRPQLERVEPACPVTGSVTMADLSWLIPGERLACFGSSEISVDGVVIADDQQMNGCGDPGVADCTSFPGEPAWIAGFPSWRLVGPAGRFGPVPGIAVWLAPSVPDPRTGEALRIRGHFDDPAADGCRLAYVAIGEYTPDALLDELSCRERFVITSIESLP